MNRSRVVQYPFNPERMRYCDQGDLGGSLMPPLALLAVDEERGGLVEEGPDDGSDFHGEGDFEESRVH